MLDNEFIKAPSYHVCWLTDGSLTNPSSSITDPSRKEAIIRGQMGGIHSQPQHCNAIYFWKVKSTSVCSMYTQYSNWLARRNGKVTIQQRKSVLGDASNCIVLTVVEWTRNRKAKRAKRVCSILSRRTLATTATHPHIISARPHKTHLPHKHFKCGARVWWTASSKLTSVCKCEACCGQRLYSAEEVNTNTRNRICWCPGYNILIYNVH